MKKLQTAIIVVLILIVGATILFFLPTEKFFANLPFIKDLYNNNSIAVKSINGTAQVSINGRDYGQTPLNVDGLAPGKYEITLKRVSENPSFYKPREYKVELPRNTAAIIDIEIGPSDSTSGYVLYYTQSPQTDRSGYITIENNVDNASISLDGEYLSRTPIRAYKLNAKEYQVKISAEGFEDTIFPVVIREGYNLTILSYQFPIPIKID